MTTVDDPKPKTPQEMINEAFEARDKAQEELNTRTLARLTEEDKEAAISKGWGIPNVQCPGSRQLQNKILENLKTDSDPYLSRVALVCDMTEDRITHDLISALKIALEKGEDSWLVDQVFVKGLDNDPAAMAFALSAKLPDGNFAVNPRRPPNDVIPLVMAAARGKGTDAALLMGSGALTFQPDPNWGIDSLQAAVRSGNPAMQALVLANLPPEKRARSIVADPTVRDEHGLTAEDYIADALKQAHQCDERLMKLIKDPDNKNYIVIDNSKLIERLKWIETNLKEMKQPAPAQAIPAPVEDKKAAPAPPAKASLPEDMPEAMKAALLKNQQRSGEKPVLTASTLSTKAGVGTKTPGQTFG